MRLKVFVLLVILTVVSIDRGMSMDENSIPKNVHERAGKEQAEQAFKAFSSPENQLRRYKESDRIKKDVFNLPDSRQTSFAGGKPSLSSERIYLFVSSSIPQRTLRNYVRTIADLDDPNIYIVLRGFIGGMKTVAPTQKFIGDLIKKNPDCVGECPSYQVNTIIDPLLFRRYAITTVPSVVYVPFIQMDGAGSEGLVENAAVSQFDTVHGDAPLDVLLEEINKKRQSGTLEGLISKLTVIPTP